MYVYGGWFLQTRPNDNDICRLLPNFTSTV